MAQPKLEPLFIEDEEAERVLRGHRASFCEVIESGDGTYYFDAQVQDNDLRACLIALYHCR